MGRRKNEPDRTVCTPLILLWGSLLLCGLVYALVSAVLTAPVTESESLALVRDSGGCCRGIENLELWGDVVKWGSEFKFNTSEECCNACKSTCTGNDGPCLCDTWVFCGNRHSCGSKFGECWLKKQKDSLAPDRLDTESAGEAVTWTSGLIFGSGEAIIGLETEYGTLRVKLFPECAPHSIAYVLELLPLHLCAGCQFYRAESRGQSWDSKGNHLKNVRLVLSYVMRDWMYRHSTFVSICMFLEFIDDESSYFQAAFGPPFALIQGTLEAQGTIFKKIPIEDCPIIRRGSVAWVGSGPEFFISLANHWEWKKEYTVFGSVLPEDMHIAERISILPTISDVWNNVNVTVLEKPVPLMLRRIEKGHGSLIPNQIQLETILWFQLSRFYRYIALL
ncbi:peptidyl-prolyl cis-trans isomerase [Spatholobus suberectus]|nr:peptidyl-prolyl cis-trans isomerase [Spatholobus suberectus]